MTLFDLLEWLLAWLLPGPRCLQNPPDPERME
jgi:hypothetical protein